MNPHELNYMMYGFGMKLCDVGPDWLYVLQAGLFYRGGDSWGGIARKVAGAEFGYTFNSAFLDEMRVGGCELNKQKGTPDTSQWRWRGLKWPGSGKD